MQVHDGRSIAKILQVAATETPLLQELVLNTGVFPSTPGSQPSVKWALCGLVQAPRLQKLVFCNLTEDFSLFRLPWAQLTHISIDACRRNYTAALSPQKIFDIMERAACLVSAQFEVGNFDWPPPDAPGAVDFTVHGNTPLVLPSLRHLSIHAGSDPSHLFQALRTPNLREFGFFSTRLPGEGIPEVLLFISRADHLTSFSTDPRCFTANEILECLRLCSSVTCLKFGLGFVPHIFDRHSSFMPRGPPALTDDDLMQHLTPSEDPNASHLCPTLKEFRCTLKACFSEEALTRFVTARQDLAAKRGLSKLERVIVAFAHIREMDAMKELESYVKSGLDLRVSYPLRLEASLSMRAGLEKILHFTDEGLSAMEHTLDRRLF
ncbi:hypothetical protein NLJ89_g6552 [Agrocybe chaxingu]|uniref:Uncharacterized protein n=1 Tax=Agrocybe chaxingu TaxID=84603 RepID=A0A9W8JYJ4_9AGAR|nr:hypothetical protein NLJ89_g6552 [Agrocybe chaxingu]